MTPWDLIVWGWAASVALAPIVGVLVVGNALRKAL